MKILLDMNLSPEWVPFLTSAGFESIHWSAIPYQTLMNLYLRDCAASGKRLKLDWKPGTSKGAA